MSIPQNRIEELLRQELEQRYPHEREVTLRLPGRLAGDGAFARLVYGHNMPARIREPGVDGNPCWLVTKRGEIHVKRSWLIEASEEGTSITWRNLPRLRRGGYLLEFTDTEMTMSALPPDDASPEEVSTMRHALTGDEIDAARQRSASLQWAAAEAAKHPTITPGTRQTPAMPYDLAFQQGQGPPIREQLNVADGRGGYQTVLTTPANAVELSRGAVDMAQLDSDLQQAQRNEGEGAFARLDRDVAQAQRRQRRLTGR